MKKVCLFVILALAASISLSAQTVSSEKADHKNAPNIFDRIIDRDSVAYGRTYGEWDAEWQQWAYSIPVANHPLFDRGDCSVGQSGPVWFLGGKFCGNNETCNLASVVRSCTIPYGKAIYLPALNGEDSVLEESVAENPGNPEALQISFLRKVLEQYIVGSTPYVIIDGVAVKDLLEKFTVESTVFSFTMPDDNYLKAVYPPGLNFPAGSYYPAVDFGQYVMIAPLPVGHHVIQFGGTNAYFTLNVKYNLNVTK